tara:strand:- start:4175 stop:4471 length:297 start_codon:yes stop_codon:yes gene_type:complete
MHGREVLIPNVYQDVLWKGKQVALINGDPEALSGPIVVFYVTREHYWPRGVPAPQDYWPVSDYPNTKYAAGSWKYKRGSVRAARAAIQRHIRDLLEDR